MFRKAVLCALAAANFMLSGNVRLNNSPSVIRACRPRIRAGEFNVAFLNRGPSGDGEAGS